MKDSFDKILRDRLHNQEIVPPADIWDKIDSSLNSIPTVTPVPKRGFLGAVIAIGSIAAALITSFLIIEINRDKPDVIVAELDPVILSLKKQLPSEEIVTTSNRNIQITANKPLSSTISPVASLKRKRAPIMANSSANAVNCSADSEDITESNKVASGKVESEDNRNKEKRVVQNYSGIISSNIAKRGNARKNRGVQFGLSGSSSLMANQNDVSLTSSSYSGISDLSLRESIYSYGDYDWNHELPLSVAFTIQKMFNHRIGIETGLVYTYLSSNSEVSDLMDIKVKQKLHYLGIPVSLVCNIVDGDKFDFYVKGGILLDKAISSTHQIFFKDDITDEKLDMSGVQLSASVQLGVSYKLSNLLSLYIEPSVNYNFDSNQIASYRTENSYGFSALVGVRFRLK